LQGDVVGIRQTSDNARVVNYVYDAYGKVCSITGSMKDTLGVHNVLRYRGYVYDNETGLYYLQSRYYNPEWGRFISADVFAATGQGLSGNNMFAYCGNNPVNRVDSSGLFWDTVLDIISLGFSIAEVVQNPNDPMAWLGVAADVASLVIPCVSGGGALVKAVTKADDVVDAVKVTDNIAEVGEVIVKYGDEVKLPNQIKASDAVDAWDDFLGPNQTNYNRFTGNNEMDRVFSADGTKSIRFGSHEMRSIGTTKAHFHYEKWLFDPMSNTVYVENILQRLQ